MLPKMSWFRNIAFMMFLVLGLNLAAESFMSSLQGDHQASTSFGSIEHSVMPGDHGPNVDHNCGDPCPTGTCHFGHCFHQLPVTSFSFKPQSTTSSKFEGSFTEPKPLYLARIKQPPRYA